MSDPHYRLVIADDHPLFRGALREAVTGLIEHAEIAEAGTFEEVPKLLDKVGEVDLILLDLSMPGVRGFSGLMYLRAQYPSVPVVVVSANDDPAVIRRCMDFGASGFIPKTLGIEQMRQAVKRVLGGGVWTPPDVDLTGGADAETAALMARLGTLTPQQVRVLMMLSEGMLNKQIAYELSVSEATVKAHVSAILQKLGVDSRTQAVIRRGDPRHAPLCHQRAERRGLERFAQHLNVLLAGGVAYMRRAVGGDQDRRQLSAEPAPQLDDGVEAVALVEMIIDQKAVGRDLRLGDRINSGREVRRFEHPAAPAAEQRVHAVQHLGLVVDAQHGGADEPPAVDGGEFARRLHQGHSARQRHFD
jgi:DNA-binding NarL/FixJ family response regulator